MIVLGYRCVCLCVSLSGWLADSVSVCVSLSLCLFQARVLGLKMLLAVIRVIILFIHYILDCKYFHFHLQGIARSFQKTDPIWPAPKKHIQTESHDESYLLARIHSCVHRNWFVEEYIWSYITASEHGLCRCTSGPLLRSVLGVHVLLSCLPFSSCHPLFLFYRAGRSSLLLIRNGYVRQSNAHGVHQAL